MSRFGYAAVRVVTCDPERPGALGVVENGVVGVDGGRIVFVGPRENAPSDATIVDLGDRVITPGLVDAHTHACWVGSRHTEYAMRLAGSDYRDIAEAGGGIVSTHRAVASATEGDLAGALTARLRRMASLGVTTVEVKSGYGLHPDDELKQLAAIARSASDDGVPAVVPTLLALHALPAGADRSAYVARVAGDLVPAVARDKLARFVDAYVDAHAFTADEARIVCDAARAAGLGVRLHAGQFADVGGAELAASVGAASIDHVEHVSAGGIRVLAGAGVTAILLPIASFTLAQAPPPVASLRQAGVAMAVASDANPGTAPSESLPLAMALAVRAYGLTPDEAILGATRVAAASLGLTCRGILRVGLRADLAIWELPHEHAIVQPWGVAKTSAVFVEGRRV
ncbi:MAG: imidazolonepropionase [Polyangiaceae bacterium]|nr:imidazolonepropionase [Polyangiaceae bacterium]